MSSHPSPTESPLWWLPIALVIAALAGVIAIIHGAVSGSVVSLVIGGVLVGAPVAWFLIFTAMSEAIRAVRAKR